MLGSEKVRAVRKDSQNDRLKMKKKSKGNEYADYFAKLPKQVAKAQVNEQIRSARQELEDAVETLQMAEETGKNLLGAQEAAHVAALFVNKLVESKRLGTRLSLTNATGAPA